MDTCFGCFSQEKDKSNRGKTVQNQYTQITKKDMIEN